VRDPDRSARPPVPDMRPPAVPRLLIPISSPGSARNPGPSNPGVSLRLGHRSSEAPLDGTDSEYRRRTSGRLLRRHRRHRSAECPLPRMIQRRDSDSSRRSADRNRGLRQWRWYHLELRPGLRVRRAARQGPGAAGAGRRTFEIEKREHQTSMRVGSSAVADHT
jgi:hypothetical protein